MRTKVDLWLNWLLLSLTVRACHTCDESYDADGSMQTNGKTDINLLEFFYGSSFFLGFFFRSFWSLSLRRKKKTVSKKSKFLCYDSETPMTNTDER